MKILIPKARSPDTAGRNSTTTIFPKGAMFMNKSRKRVGALLLALMMAFTMLPTSVFATNDYGGAFNCNLTGITKDRIDIGGARHQ